MIRAKDIMTCNVVTVSPETPIREVAELLSGKCFGSLPVTTPDGHLLGIVTEEGMAARAAEIHLPRHLEFLGSIIYLESPQRFEEDAEKILATTAREIMSDSYQTTPLDTTVDEIASLLLEHDLRRILVLDENERLVGIITRADIVRMQIIAGQFPGEAVEN